MERNRLRLVSEKTEEILKGKRNRKDTAFRVGTIDIETLLPVRYFRVTFDTHRSFVAH